MATLAAYGKNKDKRRDVTKTDMPFGGTYKHVTIKDKAGNIKKTKIKRKYPDGAKSKKVIKKNIGDWYICLKQHINS